MKVAVYTVTVEDSSTKIDDQRIDAVCEELDETGLLETAVQALQEHLQSKFGKKITVKLSE